MNNKKYLGKIVEVTIDRKLGTKHPKHNFIYTLNYGYIHNTLSGDGEELDAYILGVFEPLDTFQGECIAIIHRINNDDDKLVIVPKGEKFTKMQIKALTEFQERWFSSKIIMKSK